MVGKIEGTGPIRTPQQVRRAAKGGSAGGSSFAKQLDESSESSATQAMSGTNSISGVLGVQEIDDALAQASKGKMRASDILDRLEDLRIDLLSGTLTRDKLQQLSQVVTSHKAQINDPRLSEVLDEIDLRARVELAKYETPDRK